MHLCANMKRRLLHEEKLTYHYHSVSKEGKDSYYEAYVVKGKTDDETFDAFLGYRNIDSILYKEKEIQEKLQKALNEARLGNEIISSIARTYQYISRIKLSAYLLVYSSKFSSGWGSVSASCLALVFASSLSISYLPELSSIRYKDTYSGNNLLKTVLCFHEKKQRQTIKGRM